MPDGDTYGGCRRFFNSGEGMRMSGAVHLRRRWRRLRSGAKRSQTRQSHTPDPPQCLILRLLCSRSQPACLVSDYRGFALNPVCRRCIRPRSVRSRPYAMNQRRCCSNKLLNPLPANCFWATVSCSRLLNGPTKTRYQVSSLTVPASTVAV